MQTTSFSRRHFLEIMAASAGAVVLPLGEAVAQTQTKFRRYNVTSEGGKKALASYAKGVEAMLKFS